MQLIELAAVPSGDIPVAALASHLRLGTGFTDDGSEDAVLETYLRSAISAIEARTGKAVFQRRFSWTVNNWHGGDKQGLPIAPVQLIESVTVSDVDGGTTVVDGAAYTLVKDSQRPVLAAVSGCLPTIPTLGSVEIVLEAGFGPTWDDVPHDLRHAILVLAANYFDHRHGGMDRSHEIPFGVMALLEPYRPMRISAGGRP